MATFVHIVATAIIVSIVAVVLYWFVRRYERQQGKECAVIFALFGSALISVASIKTNSPPARAIHNLVSGIVGAFTEGYPYTRETWPFDEATEAAVAGRATTEVPPIPDDMTATGVALYRVTEEAYSPEPVPNGVRISEWDGIDADNRGVAVSLPFAFPFNGATYTNVGILSNGRLALGYATRHRRTSGGLPVNSSGGLEIVAPFWGDHLLPVADNAAVLTAATSNAFAVVWENLATPAAGVASNSTVLCSLHADGRMTWHYAPASPAVVSNVTVGVQCGTNAWTLVNGGEPTDIAALFSQALSVELVPVGGIDWAVADADGDGLTNLEEFMLDTNPDLSDTDGDGPGDRWELEHGYPPDIPLPADVLPDTDGDGVPDAWETRIGTNPLSVTTNWPSADTDGDGFLDAYEAHVGSDSNDSADPPFPDEESEKGLVSCQIDSSLPCWLVMAYDDDVQRTNEVRLAWVPNVSPECVSLLVDASRRASVYLEREETNGYWRTSLDVSVCHVSSVGKTESADADSYTAPGAPSGLRGGSGGCSSWVPPGDRIGDGYGIEYWRFLLPSESIDFCHNLGYVEILLPSLVGYTGTVSWSISPDGPSGTGNPIVFNPSALDSGAYDIVISIDTLEGTLEKTITLNVRSLSLTSSRIVVDATDTSTHHLPIATSGTFIPEGEDFVVISSPEGIDSIDFVPADLTPGTTYTVDIWNGDCGYATVTVVAFAIVSETEAEWPENRARTNLGVGEVVNLSVLPSAESVTWSCDNTKGIIIGNGSSAVLNVRDVAGSFSVSATVEGLSLSKTFAIFAPESVVRATVFSMPSIYNGLARACATINVVIGPTNVNFYNIYIMEGICQATGVTGWFAEYPYRHPAHDEQHGALVDVHPALQCDGCGNIFRDTIDSGVQTPEGTAWSPYWYSGSMRWDIPPFWWLEHDDFGDKVTHEFSVPWTEAFHIDSQGTVSVSKFGLTVSRTTTNSITVSPSSNGGNQ